MSNSPAPYQPVAVAPVARPNVSQATAIEQSRAVAEVQAAVLVAQQNRRDKAFAVAEMRDACRQTSVAERAFFKFPRAEGTVSGPSIHLARELLRCWGNAQSGVVELRRDDVKGESEMQAWAWDLETNARNSTTFIVPHKRDTRQGVRQLTDMRDIYENNANNGARRLRESIFAVLPGWFVEEAQAICRETLQGGGGVPLPTRIANSIAHFAQLGIDQARLEAKVGRAADAWTEHDVAELAVSFKSIQNGEIKKDEEFPPQQRVTVSEITATTEAAAEAPATAEEVAADPEHADAVQHDAQPSEPPTAKPATATDMRRLTAAFKAHGITSDQKESFLSTRLGRDITDEQPMTRDEVDSTIRFIETGEEPVEVSEAQA